jgi:hypothetical protein
MKQARILQGYRHGDLRIAKAPRRQERRAFTQSQNTLMRVLHKISGAIFAAGLPENTKLLDAFEKLDGTSLSQLYRHQKGVKGDGQ